MDRFTKLVSGGLMARASGPHPDANLLTAFVEGALGTGEREQVVRHLADCSDCREVLYLAAPESADASRSILLKPSRFRFALRWGAVLASVIVFAFVSTTRYSMRKVASPVTSQIALEKTPAARTQLQDQVKDERSGDNLAEPARAAMRPPEKHMTAKPATTLEFDDSGQVRTAAAAPASARADTNAPKDVFVAKNQGGREARTSGDNGYTSGAPAAPAPSQSTTEAVAVLGASAPLIANERTANEVELEKKSKMAKQDSLGGLAYAARTVQLPRWTLSPKGGVQRSLDSGKTWQAVPVAQGVMFRALSALGPDIWAGGNRGALFHSKDSGVTWSRIEPAAAGQKLEADVTRIEFGDVRNGAVSTANGETWATSDGGATWFRK